MDILRFLPKNEYDAAVSASAPTAANPFATVSDLGAYVPIAGNTGNPMTGTLSMGSGSTVSSSNGSAFLNLDYLGNANRLRIQNKVGNADIAFVDILPSNLIQLQAGNFNFGSSFSQTIYAENRVDISLYSNPFSKWGRFGIENNDAGALIPFDFASYPVYAGIRNVTINQNTESIFCAGRGYIAKSNDGMYSNRYYLSKNNEAFELAIEHQTVTGSDKVATFQNASGIVAYLSDIGLAGIYGTNGTVQSNHIATITDQLTFTGGSVRIKGESLQNSLVLENSLGITWFVATDSQSIGIGTTAPQASRILHAVGQSRFDGNIFIPNDNLYLGGNILSATGIARLRVDGVSGGEIVSFRTDAGVVGMSISDNREFIVNGDDDGSRIALGVSAGNEKIRVRMSAANVYGIRHETFGGAITFATLADGTVAIGGGSTTSKLTVIGGDVETTLNTDGFIVLDRTNATRYRIYTDGGVLNTEAA